MTQKELIELAISGVKLMRISVVEAHDKHKDIPSVTDAVLKVCNRLNEQQNDLEKMLEEAQK